uniref:Otopetrin-2 n=1 Tax=Strigamia maritima TaxID=126957 RepID=T1INK4_STRMM
MAASDDDHSSINLSLRLRRGSSDSRDSFYMDFDKGIDSDIDMEPCTRADDPATSANDCTLSSCEDETDDGEHRENDTDQGEEGGISEEKTNWVGIQRPTEGHQTLHAPSPISQSHMLASPEPTSLVSSSHGNSLPKLPNGSIDHKSPARNIHSCDAIARPRPNNGHYHRNRLETTPPSLIDMSPPSTPTGADHYIMKYSGKDDDDDDVFAQKPSRYKNVKTKDTLVVVLSAMYAKMLVVMGVGFPLAEVISSHITTSFFVVFYLYLYFGSILFLIYAYTFLLRRNSQTTTTTTTSKSLFKSSKDNVQQNKVGEMINPDLTWKKKRVEEAGVHCGSFYLRMGAVAFGIGSMIYSGLEFGQFFELDPNSACYSILVAITPCTQMAFTFIQLYFIFLNSKMCIYKYKNLARFGLMHMVATNLCIWLNVLIQESKHEILAFADHHSMNGNQIFPTTFSSSESLVLPQYNPFMEMDVTNSSFEDTADIMNQIANSSHHRTTRGIQNHVNLDTQCRRINIMGQLVQDASPFLFPCTIEYSLISAAILYIMWKNIGRQIRPQHNSISSELSIVTTSRRHHYSVDCAHANKGLFTGILILVLAIISLILFFVLINKPEFKELAVLEAHICELVLYSLCTVATFIAVYQVREMRYNPHKYIELDNILLVVAQTGVYLFAIFCIIGGHFAMDGSSILVLLTALGNLVQATVQTIFILDATRRQAISSDQMRRKPGREMITFLLVCNFAMWAINTLESRRADSNPVQLNFYGFWAWTIISHVSTPLAIFFRFHSTVCLLLISMGIAYPLAEVISLQIRDSFYVGFYLYLYLVSIAFLIYTYAVLLRTNANVGHRQLPDPFSAIKRHILGSRSFSTGDSDVEMGEKKRDRHKSIQEMRKCGSFYLRVGAIAFGIGSMIYSGLEFVQFFEVGSLPECYTAVDALKPCVHMAFTFIQLYFIFLKSKIARFGLMHMVATNVCVWLLMVVQESKHEILHMLMQEAHKGHTNHQTNNKSINTSLCAKQDHQKSFDPATEIFQLCQRQNVLGELVQKASPFLFPCTIEYSLICAAISYMMWKNIGRGGNPKSSQQREKSGRSSPPLKHHYSVDCTHTMRGLFTGILVLVAAVISVILFFVFYHHPEYRQMAVVEAYAGELVLFSGTTISVFIAMAQIRHLPYASHRNIELDSILLIVAQLGVYFFSIFGIISGHLSPPSSAATLVILTSFSRLFQATCQTVFILDASQRTAVTAESASNKPGREMITLLLVCNFAMWIIKTLKTGRTESNPVQLDFYGPWGWAIINRVSTPPAIFYRFHSTVCLCEIWKKLYKIKKSENHHEGDTTSITPSLDEAFLKSRVTTLEVTALVDTLQYRDPSRKGMIAMELRAPSVAPSFGLDSQRSSMERDTESPMSKMIDSPLPTKKLAAPRTKK